MPIMSCIGQFSLQDFKQVMQWVELSHLFSFLYLGLFLRFSLNFMTLRYCLKNTSQSFYRLSLSLDLSHVSPQLDLGYALLAGTWPKWCCVLLRTPQWRPRMFLCNLLVTVILITWLKCPFYPLASYYFSFCN